MGRGVRGHGRILRRNLGFRSQPNPERRIRIQIPFTWLKLKFYRTRTRSPKTIPYPYRLRIMEFKHYPYPYFYRTSFLETNLYPYLNQEILFCTRISYLCYTLFHTISFAENQFIIGIMISSSVFPY